MIGLRTARVVVIDDNPAEAFPIIHALGKLGIGAAYIQGDIDDLPEGPLAGIRLAFVDMNLNIAGENDHIIAKTIKVMERVIGKRASPIVIVIWTKHHDLISHFKSALKKHLPMLKPGIVLTLDKPFNYENEPWAYELPKGNSIMKEVGEAVSGLSPLDLLWSWEQVVHEATGKTSAAISDLVHRTGQDPGTDSNTPAHWCDCVRSLLGTIVYEVGGATISDGNSALRAMFAGMNPILYDRIEHIDHSDKAILKSALETAKQAEEERKAGRRLFLSEEQIGKVNKMFLLAPAHPIKGVSHQPGDIHVRRSWDKNTSPFLIGETGHVTKREVILDIADLPQSTDSQSTAYKNKRRIALGKYVPFVLELTAPCDFAQQKAKMARFIAGVLVTKGISVKPKGRAPYLKSLGFVQLDKKDGFELDGLFELIVDARFVFGVPVREIARQRPVSRLRSEALQDVIAWFAAHAARPGHISLH